MELRQLRYFVAVAEERHFSRAATRIGMAQPPLSLQVAKLERELGVQLFRRNSRHVELTPAGEALLPYVRRSLDDIDEGVRAAQQTQSSRSRELRIGYCIQARYDLLVPLVTEFRAKFPNINVALDHVNSAEQRASLLDRKLDIGFLQPWDRLDGLQMAVIERHRFMVALPLGHRLANNRSIEIEQLATETFINRPRSSHLHDFIVTLCQQAGFTPKITHEATKYLQLELVAKGLGVAVVPASDAREDIILRPLKNSKGEETLAVAWRRGNRSTEVRSFVSIAKGYHPKTRSGASQPRA